MNIENIRKSAGIGSIKYLIPGEMEEGTASKAILDKAAEIRSARGAVMICQTTNEPLPEDYINVADELCYPLDSDYVQSLIKGQSKPRMSRKWEWYWWNAFDSSPIANRLNSGLLLWKSGLYGAIINWHPASENIDPVAMTKSLTALAIREGIDDTRYLTSFMKVLREVKDLKRPKDKMLLDEAEGYLNSVLASPLHKATPAQLREIRSKIAAYAIKLESLL